MTPGDRRHNDQPLSGRVIIAARRFCGRIRIFGDEGYITLKSEPGTLTRYEFEYEIPKSDATEIIARFSIEPIIAKTRHEVPHEGMLWFVDVFEGANRGLVVAEVELEYEAQNIVMPPWAGEEVTGDRRFGNSNLARYPFVTWRDVERIAPAGSAGLQGF
jgi:adenylate cyclase